MKIQSKSLVLFLVALPVLMAGNASASTIVGTKHNLSVGGRGAIKSSEETQVCVFCHTVKRARKNVRALWNRKNEPRNYTPYQSSTLAASVGQPTGSSRVCLSCHDGTIALGGVASRRKEIPFRGGIRFIPRQRSSILGTDLSDDHPVSFTYSEGLATAKGELASPDALPYSVKLDAAGMLQCTSCHDPHDDSHGMFLVMSNRHSALCTACHQITGWSSSVHALSSSGWNRKGTNPWPRSNYGTVAENGCENCHMPHTAGRHERLLTYEFEEDTCLVCHSGNVAKQNIETEVTKRYGHFVQDFTGVHNPAEDFISGNVTKHVECEDCHNPHRANAKHATSMSPSGISGATAGVSGINAGGLAISEAQKTYEICFKCHADNNVISRMSMTRQIDQLNTRMEFASGNPSFHPVTSQGENLDVPSLLPGFTTNSIISCTDCHNNDNPTGPRGPHGSIYEFLLADNYQTQDYTEENASSYALCYQCHSRNSILNDESFSGHRKHVVDQKTPCSACHDPHGISTTQGNAANNSHLINFDLTIARPNASGSLFFQDLGRFAGQCSLQCHGREHIAQAYAQ